MTETHLTKLTRFNKLLGRVTWFFLTIGLIDHFIFDEWLANPQIPHVWFSRLMILLYALIGLIIISELAAYLLKRKLSKATSEASGTE